MQAWLFWRMFLVASSLLLVLLAFLPEKCFASSVPAADVLIDLAQCFDQREGHVGDIQYAEVVLRTFDEFEGTLPELASDEDRMSLKKIKAEALLLKEIQSDYAQWCTKCDKCGAFTSGAIGAEHCDYNSIRTFTEEGASEQDILKELAGLRNRAKCGFDQSSIAITDMLSHTIRCLYESAKFGRYGEFSSGVAKEINSTCILLVDAISNQDDPIALSDARVLCDGLETSIPINFVLSNERFGIQPLLSGYDLLISFGETGGAVNPNQFEPITQTREASNRAVAQKMTYFTIQDANRAKSYFYGREVYVDMSYQAEGSTILLARRKFKIPCTCRSQVPGLPYPPIYPRRDDGRVLDLEIVQVESRVYASFTMDSRCATHFTIDRIFLPKNVASFLKAKTDMYEIGDTIMEMVQDEELEAESIIDDLLIDSVTCGKHFSFPSAIDILPSAPEAMNEVVTYCVKSKNPSLPAGGYDSGYTCHIGVSAKFTPKLNIIGSGTSRRMLTGSSTTPELVCDTYMYQFSTIVQGNIGERMDAPFLGPARDVAIPIVKLFHGTQSAEIPLGNGGDGSKRGFTYHCDAEKYLNGDGQCATDDNGELLLLFKLCWADDSSFPRNLKVTVVPYKKSSSRELPSAY